MEATADRSPFKFLDSYTASDRDIFFGRDTEVEEVYSKVFQSNLLLVYGASGTGKSSIINCGLANKFSDSDWLPVHVRRGEHMVRSMYRQISRQAMTDMPYVGMITGGIAPNEEGRTMPGAARSIPTIAVNTMSATTLGLHSSR